tara:strand:+ start:1782 stop:3890 length:2109 start_codon:yes stop_codon:yes gene_type:complete
MGFIRCLVFAIFTASIINFNLTQKIIASEFEDTISMNSFGMPGDIDLPSATNLPDGQFSVSSSAFGGTIRVNLSFQVLENLTGAFRYARVPGGAYNGFTWDRSFDLHYLMFKEKYIFPSVAFGLRDFIGTGIYSGEYIVMTKSFGPKLKISGGVGWGRFAGKNTFNNIFGRDNRGYRDVGLGGTLVFDNIFSGNNSPFFSASYRISERLQIISEFSSDAYNQETSSSKGFNRKSDINLGIKYSFDPTLTVMATLMNGDALGLTVNLGLNPKNSPYQSGTEPAPMPILQTKYRSTDPKPEKDILTESRRLLALEGIELKALKLFQNHVEVGIVNRRYLNVSQMIGRVARILSLTTPSSAKEFQINVVDFKSNLVVSEITINREAFEENELKFDGPENLLESVTISNSNKLFFDHYKKKSNDLSWSFYPYLDVMLFDPDSPIRYHVGVELLGRYKITPLTSISGSLRKPITGIMDEVKRGPKSGLPNVRSDFMYYHRDIGSNLFIKYLTLDQYLKPAPFLYAVVNVGLLELMHAGIRAELIWKNNQKPFAFGLDVAKVRKRETLGNFKLKNEYYSTYLASIYYDLQKDWIVKLDFGKYLAGDLGSTLSINRSFNNGWEFGAYATLTDVPFSTFGEGSFEKGLTIKAPITWFTGKKSKAVANAVIRPITGDGGAKLNLSKDKYLYNNISEYDTKKIHNNWKRVFR